MGGGLQEGLLWLFLSKKAGALPSHFGPQHAPMTHVVVVVYCSWTLSTLLTYMIYDI